MELGFLLKKLIGAMAMPLSIVFFLALFALLFRAKQLRRWSHAFFALAGLLLYVFSLPITAYWLALNLENVHPKYDQQAVDGVIVLGNHHWSDERKPLSSLLSKTSLSRLTEGIMVKNQNPGAKLLLSGYGGIDVISNAEAMSRVAQAMGVASEDIELATSPKDTAEEAAYWRQHWADKRVALVTSATHMPRAIFWFKQYGLDPVPAPTNYRSLEPDLAYWKSWFPNAHSLALSSTAWHEYVGMLWARLTTH